MSDYIKREDAIRLLCKFCIGWDICEDRFRGTCNAMNALNEIPAADVVEREKGEWIWLGDCSNEGLYCSKCKNKIHETKTPKKKPKKKLSNFCPNCGADMRGADNEAD